ncbi:serine protease [Massilia sp. MB5]|uniref:S1 family peptidase n=1 Tax=unclassified Massilia TaxID=2609279 RepID=UPI0009E5476D|nr:MULTISPECIES: serine protease [unclassified Massilia]UMR32059.1 serine protease [Massilia sp. MB5]
MKILRSFARRGTRPTRLLAGAVLLAAALGNLAPPARASDFPHVIASIKPSVVGVGTYMRARSPAIAFVATGFVVGDGLSVISNAHAIPDILDIERKETLGIVTGAGDKLEFRPATVSAVDREHDLVHLRLSGAPLPALQLGPSDSLAEGQALAFTGFPLGMTLGLNRVTHRATLSAITPMVLPPLNSSRLDARLITQLQRAPFQIFQLDGTAYPGNSGSPVYDPESGTVYAVINMGFVKGLKENAISNPSGISYAIPAVYVQQLLNGKPGSK